MTTDTHDAPLLDDTDPSLARPLPATVLTARADVLAAAQALLAIPEATLTKPWGWIGGSEDEVRYGAYRAAEALEEAEIEARTVMAAADRSERQAARIIGPVTAARWDLHGLMAPLEDGLLDADPGGGEWTLRLVMGHIIASQRGYAWANAWIAAHGPDPADPARQILVPDEFWEALPDEATTEAEGSIDDLLHRLDAITDLSAERLAGTPDEKLTIPARWAGFPVPLGFRYVRWASHIREHSIQVQKTLGMLGAFPDEPAYLVRNVLSAYGRAELVVFGRQDVDAAAGRIALGAAEARAAAEAVRTAAGV